MPREKLDGRANWYCKEMEASGDWIRTLDDTQRREIDRALAQVKRARLPLLLNNHVIFHGRTAYEDDSASHQERLLLRLWLSMPNSRRLPAGFETFWGSTEPGALRGGVIQQATGQRVPLKAA